VSERRASGTNKKPLGVEDKTGVDLCCALHSVLYIINLVPQLQLRPIPHDTTYQFASISIDHSLRRSDIVDLIPTYQLLLSVPASKTSQDGRMHVQRDGWAGEAEESADR